MYTDISHFCCGHKPTTFLTCAVIIQAVSIVTLLVYGHPFQAGCN